MEDDNPFPQGFLEIPELPFKYKNITLDLTNSDDNNSSPEQPSPFSFSSPLPSPPTLLQSQDLSVILTHKPRGSGGVWKQVEGGEKLRVTKGKGKCLKLEVALPDGVIYDPSQVRLMLVDLDTTPATISQDGFVIEVGHIS
jgi:hypothetical protein